MNDERAIGLAATARRARTCPGARLGRVLWGGAARLPALSGVDRLASMLRGERAGEVGLETLMRIL